MQRFKIYADYIKHIILDIKNMFSETTSSHHFILTTHSGMKHDSDVPKIQNQSIRTTQEQTQRYITHTTTNTQPAFGSVLIKGRTKLKGSKNVP